jgi:hypothetical protein
MVSAAIPKQASKNMQKKCGGHQGERLRRLQTYGGSKPSESFSFRLKTLRQKQYFPHDRGNWGK